MDEVNKDEARRVALSVSIGGHDATSYLEPCLLSFSYSDNASGKADSIQLELQDREGRWSDAWAPVKGTRVMASLRCLNWFGPGEHAALNCGAFSVDEVQFSGVPDKVSLKAVSASLNTTLRETAKTRAWEGYSLEGVAQEMAAQHGLTLLYDAPAHTFARQDQREESDLAFLTRLSRERGVNVKVHDGKMALYGAKEADSKPGVLTISKKGGQFSPKSYSFKEKSAGTAYSACEVNYRDPATQEVYTYAFDAQGQRVQQAPGDAKKIWSINQRVESEADARKLAQNSLRAKNGGECTGSLEIMGHPGLVAGITISLTGFGRFSGEYFVEKAEHKIGSGYTTSAEVRRVLSY